MPEQNRSVPAATTMVPAGVTPQGLALAAQRAATAELENRLLDRSAFLNRVELAQEILKMHTVQALPLGAAFDTIEWPEEPHGSLFDVALDTLYDADGEEVDSPGGSVGAYFAGRLLGDGGFETDWDVFKITDPENPNAGRISVAAVLDWAARAVTTELNADAPADSPTANPVPTRDLSEDPDLAEAVEAAQAAARGDSNDAEIDLLRDALEMALDRLGYALPPSIDD